MLILILKIHLIFKLNIIINIYYIYYIDSSYHSSLLIIIIDLLSHINKPSTTLINNNIIQFPSILPLYDSITLNFPNIHILLMFSKYILFIPFNALIKCIIHIHYFI